MPLSLTPRGPADAAKSTGPCVAGMTGTTVLDLQLTAETVGQTGHCRRGSNGAIDGTSLVPNVVFGETHQVLCS
jgi:hypothetical protein